MKLYTLHWMLYVQYVDLYTPVLIIRTWGRLPNIKRATGWQTSVGRNWYLNAIKTDFNCNFVWWNCCLESGSRHVYGTCKIKNIIFTYSKVFVGSLQGIGGELLKDAWPCVKMGKNWYAIFSQFEVQLQAIFCLWFVLVLNAYKSYTNWFYWKDIWS